jgi:DNA-binding MarR family transcriptional regulator
LDTDLGWALGAVFRRYVKRTAAVVAEVPGGPRGYQVLAASAPGVPGTQLALAQQLGVDRTVMTYLLDDLEKAGLVERRPDPTDRRARRIVATPSGGALLARLQRQLAEVEEDVLGVLESAERVTFRELLQRVATHVPGPQCPGAGPPA